MDGGIADSRRIIGAEIALAVLLRGIADDAGMWSDVTAHATVDADTLDEVMRDHLRPRWQVNDDGTVEFWLEGESNRDGGRNQGCPCPV